MGSHNLEVSLLIGPTWLIEHLRKPKGSGNTPLGRAISARARSEQSTVIFKCDDCGSEEHLLYGDRLRHRIKVSIKHETKFQKHLCEVCVIPYRNAAAQKTRASEAYRTKIASKPSWQSQADEYVLKAWVERGRKTRIETAAKKTPEQRSEGVRKQWLSLTEDAKSKRALKIGASSRARWAAMTPEQRSAQVKKMIRGLPRSGISNDFRGALIREGLYDGFQSEYAISGFVADEVNPTEKLVLEFYGDYFHCNPRIYPDPDYYNTTLHMTAEDKWQYDRRRLAAFRKNGYRVLVVWESDWRKDPSAVLKIVREFRGNKHMRNEDEGV